ncbi:MAG: hypothetical protein AB7L92_08515, partial [Alphaproteobacteria bacterium]
MYPDIYITGYRIPRLVKAMLLLVVLASPAHALLDVLDGQEKGYVARVMAEETDASFKELLGRVEEALKKNPAPENSEPMLRYRYEQDRTFIEKMLHAHGYYDAVIDGELNVAAQEA